MPKSKNYKKSPFVAVFLRGAEIQTMLRTIAEAAVKPPTGTTTVPTLPTFCEYITVARLGTPISDVNGMYC